MVRKPEGRTSLLEGGSPTLWPKQLQTEGECAGYSSKASTSCLRSTAVEPFKVLARKRADLTQLFRARRDVGCWLCNKDPSCRVSISLHQQRCWGLQLHPSNENLQDSPLCGGSGASTASTQLSCSFTGTQSLLMSPKQPWHLHGAASHSFHFVSSKQPRIGLHSGTTGPIYCPEIYSLSF